jgi:DNA helicase-2/ATP-dependent DNA helicase PcrA
MPNNTAFVPSTEQAAFLQAVETALPTGGALVLRARAGTGKTASIKLAIEALKAAHPGLKIQYLVFNKKNSDEAAEKLGRLASVNTLNSFGWRSVMRAIRGVRLDGNVSYLAIDEIESHRPKAERWGSSERGDLKTAWSLARQGLVRTEEEMSDLVARHGLGDGLTENEALRFQADAWKGFMMFCETGRTLVDFDDQVFLAVEHGFRVDQFDVVFVDEAQDLSPAKLALARMAVKPGGLFVAVGDDRQAIYGFAGADPESLPNIIRETAATVLPLTVTRRCPKAVVALAQRLVPDYVAHEDAPEGSVSSLAGERLLDVLVAGDAVVSRTNAPLVATCLKLLARGTAAKIMGRKDVAEGLVKLIKKAKTDDVGDLLEFIGSWRDREVAKLLKANKSVDAVCDKCDCIFALAEGVFTVADLLARIERIFTDTEEGRVVLLSSTHRAKGLEWNRVYLLEATYRPGSEDIQEDNLLYVAITRAKQELVMVQDLGKPRRRQGGGEEG